MQEYTLRVPLSHAGSRLDLFLLGCLKDKQEGISRTFIQKMIAEGRVTRQGILLKRPHVKVKAEEEIRITIKEREPESMNAEDIPLDVIYEDEDLAVINKPSGLVVHPAPGNQEHTLVNALLNRFKNLSNINPKRPGIVHRLDKDTSGILLIAKTNFAHLDLAKQFSGHSIKRKYIAIVKGSMEFDEDVIEASIGRHPFKRKNMAVSFAENTKYAKTLYRTIMRLNGATLIELEPFTGRTHQLRVHLSFIGHPVLGDPKYGRRLNDIRLALHAKSISFRHPRTGKTMSFTSPIPEEFNDFIDKNKA
jgi:23S rRNA pseudouridine1911/1915/1917 synthase